jgi:hypothetical protein
MLKSIKMLGCSTEHSSNSDSQSETHISVSSPLTEISIITGIATKSADPYYKPTGNTAPFAQITCDLLSFLHERVMQPGPTNTIFYNLSKQPRLIESANYCGDAVSFWTFKRPVKVFAPSNIDFAGTKWKKVKFEYYIWADMKHKCPERRYGPPTISKSLRSPVRSKRNGMDPGWEEIVAALKRIMARYERNGL